MSKFVGQLQPYPGAIMRLCILTLLHFLPAITASAESWKFLYQENGIDVFSNAASPSMFKAAGVLDVDVVDILAVFSDVPRRTEWVRNLEESRVLLDNHVDRVLVYNRYHLPWPARDRDSLIETKYTNDHQNGEVTIRFKATEAVGEPPRKNVIRLTKVDGVLYLKVLAEGRTFVRYEVDLDPGGWLPQWICNFFVRDAPKEMLQAMKQRIAEQQHLRPDCREQQMRLWHGGHRK